MIFRKFTERPFFKLNSGKTEGTRERKDLPVDDVMREGIFSGYESTDSLEFKYLYAVKNLLACLLAYGFLIFFEFGGRFVNFSIRGRLWL